MRQTKYNTIEIDTKNLKQELLDPDQYPAEVVDVRRMGGTWLVSFHILDLKTGDVLTNITDRFQTDVAGQRRLAKFCNGIGEDIEATGKTDPNEWPGKLCIVDLKILNFEDGTESNKITGYYRFEESKLAEEDAE